MIDSEGTRFTEGFILQVKKFELNSADSEEPLKG